LSVAYDIETADLGSAALVANVQSIRGTALSSTFAPVATPEGNHFYFYAVAGSSKRVFMFDLATPYEYTDASMSFSTSPLERWPITQTGAAFGIDVLPDGKYIAELDSGSTTNALRRRSLPTPFSLAGGTDTQIDIDAIVPALGSGNGGIAIDPWRKVAYVTNRITDTLYQLDWTG
jgi:hypothetical protein